MTITARDVQGMGGRVMRSAVGAGVDVENWALVTGSSTYGRQYRIVKRDPKTGGERDLHLLGLTRSEAYRGLYGMAVAFEMVAEARGCQECGAAEFEPCHPFCTSRPDAQDDGTNGQDRESYTDTQDRENYS